MLSFIVPAHDEARRIGATLAALHAAAATCGLRYEIVVVDDASADGTADLAREAGARVLRVEHRHIAATRNAGAAVAAGEQLVFVDADTQVSAGLLKAALAALDAGAVGGGATIRLNEAVRWHEHAATAAIAALLRLARIAPGCFIFCTRRAFESVGGFDERYFAGEDVALSRALARAGRFVVLRERALSSGRKLRTFPLREHLRLLGRVLLRGRRVLHSREALDLWYARRRESGPGDRPGS